MSANKPRVLLTGATGFLGKATADTLQQSGFEIIRAVRHPCHPGEIKLDFSDLRSFESLLGSNQFDVMVHIGAKVDFQTSAIDDFFPENICATAILLWIARSVGSQFVFASTALVGEHPPTNNHSFFESCSSHPYAKSKWIGELLAAASGVNATILRFGGIYGRNGPEHLGINKAIRSAAIGITPTVLGEGLAQRNYIYVKDAAQQIEFAITNRVYGTHIIAGTENLSIREMLGSVCETFLPGKSPLHARGPETTDQIFKPSSEFPKTRLFSEGLADILEEVARCSSA